MITFFDYKKEFKNPDTLLDLHWWNKNDTSLHGHNYYELFIITKGNVIHQFKNSNKITCKNTVCLIKPNDIHCFLPYNNSSTQHLNISIEDKYFQNLCDILDNNLKYKIENFKEELSIILNDQEYEYIINLSNQIYLFKQEGSIKYLFMIKNIILNILSFINIKLINQNNYPEWFNDLLNKINAPNFVSNNVDAIYNIAPYSPPILISYFKKYTGLNIINYLTKLKINYACNLLENTNFSTLQISSKIGYDSLSHFNRIFKNNIGSTPSTFRKQKQNIKF